MARNENWRVEMGSYPIPGIGGGYAHSFIMIIDPMGNRYLFEGHGKGREGTDEPGGWEHFIPFYDDSISAGEGDIFFAHERNRFLLFEGPKEIVFDQIRSALILVSNAINDADLDYEPITLDPFDEAQNSNSVVRTYTDVIEAIVERNGGEYLGVPDYYTDDEVLWHQNNSVYLPGWDRNLLDQIGVDIPDLIEQAAPTSLPLPLHGQPRGAQDQALVGGQRSDAATTSVSGAASGSAAARGNASTRTSATSLLGRLSAATSSATAKSTGSKTAKKAADGKLAKALSQPRDPWESLLTVPGASMNKRQKEQIVKTRASSTIATRRSGRRRRPDHDVVAPTA